MSIAPKLLAVDNVTKVFTIGGFHRVRLKVVEGFLCLKRRAA